MRLFVWEIRKLAADGAARAGLLVVAICLVLGMIGFRFAPSAERGTTIREKRARGETILPTVYRRGFGYARLVLGPAAGVLVPAILCIVLGGTLAGESERGTLAEALARPTGRWKIVAAKTGAGLAYGAVLVSVAAVVVLLVGALVLGAGELATGQPKLVQLTGDGLAARKVMFEHLTGADAVGRLVLAYALAWAGLAPLVALVVLASATAERSRTATLVAAGTYFGLYALTHTRGMEAVRHYLVLNHFEMWSAAMGTQIEWGRVWRGAAVLAVAFSLLTAAAILVFGGREFPGRPDG